MVPKKNAAFKKTHESYGGGVPKSSGRGGGGGGGGSSEKWENPYDKYYNLSEEINETIREREKIERRYQKLLESHESSANRILELSRQELDKLAEQAKLQRELFAGRQQQIRDEIAENADLNQYANVTFNESGEAEIRIDWDKINAVTDQEKGEEIEEYIS